MPVIFTFLAGVVCLMPNVLERLRAWIAVVASIVALLLVWPIFTSAGMKIDLGYHMLFRADRLSSFVLLLTAVFGVLISIYSIGFMKGKERNKEYYTYFFWTLSASFGAILANDFVPLLICWGFLGLTLYLMIGLSGPDASAAAKKAFIIIGGSDSVLLLGVAILWKLTGSTRMDNPAILLSHPAIYVAFFCFVAAAFAKAGAVPFHTWVPDCGEKAYAPVSAFLPASLDKLLGIYLLARMVQDLFVMNGITNGFLMLFGAVTVIFAVMMALVQHDMKRLLSYHAVSQVGYMVLGIGSGTAIGIAGGLFHMLNHAMYKSTLFLCAGSVEKQTGTSDLDKLGGLATAMPLTFIGCLVAAMAISGVPPLNGFASKWMVYQGIISARGASHLWIIWLAAAMFGSALTLASFVKVLHAAFLCKRSAELRDKDIRESGPSIWLPIMILAAACVVFGVAAYKLPLRYLVLPAVPEAVYIPGVWWAASATVMLSAVLIVGVLIYLLTLGKIRRTESYIGGEVLAEHVGENESIEVTGVDFYAGIQQMEPFKTIYRMAAKKLFDIYDVGTNFIFYFVGALRKAHAGLLPLYLTWVLAGLLAILYVLIRGIN